MTPWENTVEDSLESILELEKLWKEKGVGVDEVLGKNWSLDFWKVTTTSRVECGLIFLPHFPDESESGCTQAPRATSYLPVEWILILR